jgi:serine/threonine protein kinase
MIQAVPGATIDGFTLGECVHRGAMGMLFAVTRPGIDFPMLMKVPLMGEADSAELLLAFETEAMILPRLRGRHAPRFVAAGDVSTLPYIVTERIEGASLDHRAPAVLPVPEVARVGAAIADALHDLHEQGVIHFDLKPDNVLLRPDGSAVMVDFGLAHHRDLPDLLHEEKRFAAGSAPYISPEQVHGDRSDARSDLFALGALLYELATGHLPFGAPTTMAGMRDRAWMQPRPLYDSVPNAPPWLQEVVLRCLEPNPSWRYQTAAHVALDLRHPEQVLLTERARRRVPLTLFAQASRWWRSREHLWLTGAQERLPQAGNVVMVAVDTMHPDDPRQPELQRVTSRILSLGGEFRLICVSVIPASLERASAQEDHQVEHRLRLRHWMRPLGIPPERVTMHVLESSDPADALVDFGRRNNVDLIVLGAPAPDERALAWWRSVASGVTAGAHCSVHVVRVPQRSAVSAAVDDGPEEPATGSA